jgi:ABC-type antimicrobial peptide transport system permease subunit
MLIPYLLSITVLVWCVGLTLGLWERGLITLEEIAGNVGKNTWLVQMRGDFSGNSVGLPTSPEKLQSIDPQLKLENIAFRTSSSRPTTGFAIINGAVSPNYYAVRQLRLAKGKYATEYDQIVVGFELAKLLEQRDKQATLGRDLELNSRTYRVVGVLASVALRGETSGPADWEALIPLEGYTGYAQVDEMYIRADNLDQQSFKTHLERWLKSQNLTAYEFKPLLSTIGVEQKTRASLLLSQGLIMATLAVLVLAVYSLVGFQTTRMIERIPILGMCRACGATGFRLQVQEMLLGLRWLLLLLLAGVPMIYLVNWGFTQLFNIDARPSWRTILLTVLLVAIVTVVSTWIPTRFVIGRVITDLVKGRIRFAARDWFALTGLTLGVMALILQNSSNQIAIAKTEEIIGKVGDRVATLATSLTGEGFADPRAPVRLNIEDFESLKQKFPTELSKTAFVSNFYLDVQKEYVDIRGFYGDYLALIGATILKGRELKTDALEVMVGIDLVKALNLKNPTGILGKPLSLFNKSFKVVGIYKTASESVIGGARSDQILVSLGTVNARGIGTGILVEVRDGLAIFQNLQKAADFLTSRHSGPDQQPVRVYRPNDFAPSLLLGLKQVSLLYLAIAGILFLLAGIALFSQQWLWVIAHTAEIGVRRAFGATRQSIFATLLLHVFRRALLAAFVGIVTGVTLIAVVARVQQQDFLLDWLLVLLAPGIAVFIAFCATWIPSEIATRITPALAVRLKN